MLNRKCLAKYVLTFLVLLTGSRGTVHVASYAEYIHQHV